MGQKLLFAGIVAVLAVVAVVGFSAGQTRLGSVATPESYYSTTTVAGMASTTGGWKVCSGYCVLGSIVVDQPGSAGWVRVWDATSTATSSYRGQTTTGTYGRELGQITGASDVGGTYTYDVVATKGLVIEVSSTYDGHYVVTYK